MRKVNNKIFVQPSSISEWPLNMNQIQIQSRDCFDVDIIKKKPFNICTQYNSKDNGKSQKLQNQQKKNYSKTFYSRRNSLDKQNENINKLSKSCNLLTREVILDFEQVNKEEIPKQQNKNNEQENLIIDLELQNSQQNQLSNEQQNEQQQQQETQQFVQTTDLNTQQNMNTNQHAQDNQNFLPINAEKQKKQKQLLEILNDIHKWGCGQCLFRCGLVFLALVYYIQSDREEYVQLEYVTIFLFLIIDIFDIFKGVVLYQKVMNFKIRISHDIDQVDMPDINTIHTTNEQNKSQGFYWKIWVLIHELLTTKNDIMYFLKVTAGIFHILLIICGLSILFQNGSNLNPLSRLYLILQMSEIILLIFFYIINIIYKCLENIIQTYVYMYDKRQQKLQKLMVINNLPKNEYNKVKHLVTTPHCCICLSEYAEQDLVILLNCDKSGRVLNNLRKGSSRGATMHCFHKDCLQSWLKVNTSCPYCRQQIQLKNQNFDAEHVK